MTPQEHAEALDRKGHCILCDEPHEQRRRGLCDMHHGRFMTALRKISPENREAFEAQPGPGSRRAVFTSSDCETWHSSHSTRTRCGSIRGCGGDDTWRSARTSTAKRVAATTWTRCDRRGSSTRPHSGSARMTTALVRVSCFADRCSRTRSTICDRCVR